MTEVCLCTLSTNSLPAIFHTWNVSIFVFFCFRKIIPISVTEFVNSRAWNNNYRLDTRMKCNLFLNRSSLPKYLRQTDKCNQQNPFFLHSFSYCSIFTWIIFTVHFFMEIVEFSQLPFLTSKSSCLPRLRYHTFFSNLQAKGLFGSIA